MLRLLNWSFVVGLSRGGPLQPAGLESSPNQKTILNNLIQQQAVLERFLSQSQGSGSSVSIHQDTSSSLQFSPNRRLPAISRLLLGSITSSIIVSSPEQPHRTASHEPHRDGHISVEDAIAIIQEKNERLRAMLDSASLELLLEKDEETNLELLQLCEKPADVVNLARAVYPGALSSSDESGNDAMWSVIDTSETSSDTYTSGLRTRKAMARFARFRALNIIIEDTALDSKNNPRAIKLSPKAMVLMRDEIDEERNLRTTGLCRGQDRKLRPIWVEWKEYEPPIFGLNELDPKIHARVRALATLLNDSNKPMELCAPQCLGYFDDLDPETGEPYCRFGLAFEVPTHIRASGGSLEPISLLEVIRSQASVSVMDRLELASKIATSVLYLHAVNWLHKGLRSESILFFDDETGKVNLQTPILSGFDYSRPALVEDMTEKPPENVSEDIYRHPRVQGSGNRLAGYKKTYDIYSLGIVLLEIAYWKPIDSIMGIKELHNARPSVVIKVRHRILIEEEHILDGVSQALDPIFQDVVKACIEGPLAFGLEDGANERDSVNAATLQAGFYRKVVRRLKRVMEGM